MSNLERLVQAQAKAIRDLCDFRDGNLPAETLLGSLTSVFALSIQDALRNELAQIRALTNARDQETTVHAVKRLVTERDGNAAKARAAEQRERVLRSEFDAYRKDT